MARSLYWIWLSLRMGEGKAGVAELLEYFGSPENIYDADEYDCQIGEDGQLQFRAAKHEKENEQRRCPTVDSIHEFFGEITNITENRTKHHARKQRGERDMYFPNMEFKHGKPDGEEYEPDGNGKSFGTGMEKPFAEGEYRPCDCPKPQRADDFQEGIDNDGNEIDFFCADCSCNPERDREKHEPYRVVQSNDGE